MNTAQDTAQTGPWHATFLLDVRSRGLRVGHPMPRTAALELGDARHAALPDALKAQGWRRLEDGRWYLSGDGDGCTQEEARQLEDIPAVRQSNIGTGGTVRGAYQTTVWAAENHRAFEAAGLPVVLLGFACKMTDSPTPNDFEAWAISPPFGDISLVTQ